MQNQSLTMKSPKPRRRNSIVIIAGILLAGGFSSNAQFTNADWPSTIDTNSAADYAIFDPSASFASTPAGWVQSLSLSCGGDQAFVLANIYGLHCDHGTSSFLNI